MLSWQIPTLGDCVSAAQLANLAARSSAVRTLVASFLIPPIPPGSPAKSASTVHTQSGCRDQRGRALRLNGGGHYVVNGLFLGCTTNACRSGEQGTPSVRYCCFGCRAGGCPAAANSGPDRSGSRRRLFAGRRRLGTRNSGSHEITTIDDCYQNERASDAIRILQGG